MVKYLILELIGIGLCGCDNNPHRQKDLDRTIMTSGSGVKYLVEHNFGANYTFTPIKEKIDGPCNVEGR